MMWKYAAAWFPMMFIAIANGAAREFLYKAPLGELRAHQLSTLSGLILFGIYIWFIVRKWRPGSSGQAMRVGLLWLGMTLTFEFGFGHFMAGKSWTTLFEDYNLLAGRVWVFIPLWVMVAPYLFYRFQR
ncbi:MAG: hypothetical protein HGB19_02045 [Chlorobiales bacterium]|jgi:hypothetical protein|nr:hypothetical protein [Chlorobiales bacterium]